MISDEQIRADVEKLVPEICMSTFNRYDEGICKQMSDLWTSTITNERDRALKTAEVREYAQEWPGLERGEWRRKWAEDIGVTVETVDSWLEWVDDVEKFKADNYPTAERFREYRAVAQYWPENERHKVPSWDKARDIAFGKEPDPRTDSRQRFANVNRKGTR